MRIAMIGTRGVPARYGGFETAVEEIGSRLAARGHRVRVFCRPVPGEPRPDEHLGMALTWLPALQRRSLETLSHTARTVVHRRLSGADCGLVFNAANAPLLPVLRARRIPVATHVDGLEWQRGKWGPTGRRYYRAAESLAVRWSDALIADAAGIADYYRREFGADTTQIAYGAPIQHHPASHRLAELSLEPRGYHLVVARFEPENHVLEIVRGYAQSAATRPLVVVGSAPYADDYTAAVTRVAEEARVTGPDGTEPRVRLLGGVWDAELLDQLYAGALTYLHGHSVGGTNPSLLRAVGAGTAVNAWDVGFNREVVGENGRFFDTPAGLAAQLVRDEADPAAVQDRALAGQRAIARYDWDDVATRYEELCADLVRTGPRRHRPSGRRQRG